VGDRRQRAGSGRDGDRPRDEQAIETDWALHVDSSKGSCLMDGVDREVDGIAVSLAGPARRAGSFRSWASCGAASCGHWADPDDRTGRAPSGHREDPRSLEGEPGVADLGVGAGVGGYVTWRAAAETVARHLARDAAVGDGR
jgi:hypothetical protein